MGVRIVSSSLMILLYERREDFQESQDCFFLEFASNFLRAVSQ